MNALVHIQSCTCCSGADMKRTKLFMVCSAVKCVSQLKFSGSNVLSISYAFTSIYVHVYVHLYMYMYMDIHVQHDHVHVHVLSLCLY